MANWTPEPQPFGANRTPAIFGISESDGTTPVPIAVDPATGRMLVNATGGTAATSVAINDGVSTSTKATVKSLTDSNPLTVAIVDTNGDQIASFGGGTQYAQGTVVATPTGTVSMMKAFGNTINPVESSGLVGDVGSDPDVTLGVTPHISNGSTVDRIVSATKAGGTTGVGLLGAGLLGFDGTDYQLLKVDGSANLKVAMTSTTITGTVAATQSGTWTVGLSAGSAVIGHVITDSGSVTNATLSAETTKVIGTVRNADGAGNLWTSNSSTFTAKFAQDVNVLGTLGTAFSTAGKVDVKAASGDLPVTNTGTFAVQNTPVSPATIFNGKTTVTTAGTRVTLASSTTVRSIVVKALTSNTGTIYVGNSTVAASNGLQLAAGESVAFDLTNLNTVNIDSSVNGEGVTYMAVN